MPTPATITGLSSAQASVLEMSRAYVLSRAIHVAAELGLADHIADVAVTAEQLARLVPAQPKHIERLLRLLAAHGIFSEQAPGKFVATDRSRVMREDAPDSLRPGLCMVNAAWWDAVGHLADAVSSGEPSFRTRQGLPFFAYLKHHPEDQLRFDAGMASNSRAAERAIAAAYDFGSVRSLVDIGGGRGGLVRAIVERHAAVHCMLFDQPQVVSHAHVSNDERCTVVAGDFFEAIPAGAELYSIKGVLHDFDDERCAVILANIRRALTSAGRLLIVERTVSADNTPHPAKTIDLMMMALLGGRERTTQEWQALLGGAGFRMTRQVPTASEFTISEAKCA